MAGSGETILTVTSVDSISQFPSNKVADFRSKIDLQLDPEHEYEACLYACSYIKNWYNAKATGHYWMEFLSARDPNSNYTVHIPPAFYTRDDFAYTVQIGVAKPRKHMRQSDRHSECELSFASVDMEVKMPQIY